VIPGSSQALALFVLSDKGARLEQKGLIFRSKELKEGTSSLVIVFFFLERQLFFKL
jgi:hypothetical protein